jgi:hypothetical protein
MAFQTGTQIRPELANADYSGFVNAANIRAGSIRRTRQLQQLLLLNWKLLLRLIQMLMVL